MNKCTEDPPFRIFDIPLIIALTINISDWGLSQVKKNYFVSLKTNFAIYLQPTETAFMSS